MMKKEALYITIEKYILNKIKSGEYKMGDLIPSESSLTKQFNTSRGTVNKALFDLTNKGYIYRTPGRGSFVRSTTSKDDITFQEIVKNAFNSRDLKRITVTELMNETDQNSILIGPENSVLSPKYYQQSIDLLKLENEIVGLSVVIAHNDVLRKYKFDELVLDSFSKNDFFRSDDYNRKILITRNRKTEISKELELGGFPINIEVIVEENNEIILAFEIFTNLPEFSFSF